MTEKQYTVTAGQYRNFNVAGAAKYLCISERYIRELIAAGKIPHARIGRRIILRESSLNLWLDENGFE